MKQTQCMKGIPKTPQVLTFFHPLLTYYANTTNQKEILIQLKTKDGNALILDNLYLQSNGLA